MFTENILQLNTSTTNTPFDEATRSANTQPMYLVNADHLLL